MAKQRLATERIAGMGFQIDNESIAREILLDELHYFYTAVNRGDLDRAGDRIGLFGSPEELNEFIKNKTLPVGTTILDGVCARGDLAMLKFLVKAGVDINATNKVYGLPPMYYAINNDNNIATESFIKEMLDLGADVDMYRALCFNLDLLRVNSEEALAEEALAGAAAEADCDF